MQLVYDTICRINPALAVNYKARREAFSTDMSISRENVFWDIIVGGVPNSLNIKLALEDNLPDDMWLRNFTKVVLPFVIRQGLLN